MAELSVVVMSLELLVIDVSCRDCRAALAVDGSDLIRNGVVMVEIEQRIAQ